MRTALLCAALGIFGVATTVNAAVIVNETFDTYATTADMQAHWGSTGLGTLDTSVGNTGNSAFHPGGAINSWIGSSFSVAPSAAENVVLTADIYDDGVNSTNKRNTVGLRNGVSPLFEMGFYNGTTNKPYNIRVVNFAGNESYIPFDAPMTQGWNRFQATFSTTGVTVTLDLGADGTIDSTLTSTGSAPANPFVDLRFGGPSGVSSAGGGMNVDNIRLETVPAPEPASLSLLALGAAPLLRRRRA